MLYREEAKKLFDTYVPDNGQADTVQGELIRNIFRLRQEAYRNGNVNWDEGFEIMADFLQATLCDSGDFSESEQEQIKKDIVRIKDYEDVLLNDEVYDRIVDKVVEWSRKHPAPIEHVQNPALRR